ncbi:MAG: hypothetical protein AAFO58_06420 [Pseudomonadota bacterium]
MSEKFVPKRVENYTNAFLVSAGMLTFFSLWVLAAAIGFIGMVVTAVAIDTVLKVIGGRK